MILSALIVYSSFLPFFLNSLQIADKKKEKKKKKKKKKKKIGTSMERAHPFRQTNIQSVRQTGKQTDRQTHMSKIKELGSLMCALVWVCVCV